MMRWLVLLLVLTTDSSALTEDVGAKAMFKDPSLNVLHFSPHRGDVKPPGETLPEARNQRPRQRPTSSAPSGPSQDPVSIADSVRSIGIRFWVQQVNEQGKVLAEMEVGHIFRSGERIQLVIEPNTNGYIAVVQQGSDGRAGLLFPPHEGELEANRILAYEKVVLPNARYAFTFDQATGTERLLIILVRDRQQLAELPLRQQMEPKDIAAVRQLAARELGAKNLVIEAFADPKDDPATYAVNRAGSAIVQEIALVHEK